jgi:long-chain fatty acid transport protein
MKFVRKYEVNAVLSVLAICPMWAISAETLSLVPDTAEALSTAGGRYANLKDASVVRVSPGNMLDFTEPEVLVNASVWKADISFQSLSGAQLEVENPWRYPVSLYGIVPLKEKRIALGLGVSTPFGLGSDYGRSNDLKYVVPYESELLTLSLTPAVAIQVTDSLRIGIGLDVMYARLQISQVYPWSAALGARASDGEVNMDGDGWGVGGYMGVNWEIAKGHRLAFVGRLPITVTYTGDFEGKGMPRELQGAGFTRTGDFDSEMTFPGSVALGYGVDVNERLTLGFDFKWSANSSHDDIPLNVGSNQSLLPTRSVELDWEDSIDLGAAATWKLSKEWAFRTGYLFSENSQPDRTYTPSIPANDRHIFAMGLGWRGEKNSVDLAYAFVYNPDRQVSSASQPLFDGEYRHQWHVLTVSVAHRF